VHEADAHPVHHQARRALADFAEPESQAALLWVAVQGREVACNREVDQALQQAALAAGSQQFEMAEAGE
jgi:hypothetical protein